MDNFNSNEITLKSEDIARELKRIREERRVDIKRVSKELGINVKYLEILEGGNYDLLPAGTYGSNFLREYASYLGINNKEVLNFFHQNNDSREFKKKESLFVQKTTKGFYFLSIPKIIKNSLVIVLVSVFLVYLAFYLNRIISAPLLIVENPKDNISISDFEIRVDGVVDLDAELKINDELILPDSNGNFAKEVDLKIGLNTIVIRARKKYSKESVIVKKILVYPKNDEY